LRKKMGEILRVEGLKEAQKVAQRGFKEFRLKY
jgi:hypothetical protein